MLLILFAVILVFASIALFVFNVMSQRTQGPDPVAARLAEIKSTTEGGSWWQARRAQRRPVWERLLARLAGFLPNADGSESIRDGLTEAGLRGPNAVTTFLGAKVLLGIGLPLIFLFVLGVMGVPFGNIVVWMIVLGVVGFYLPTLWLWSESNKRKLEVTHALPDALDLMVGADLFGEKREQLQEAVASVIEEASTDLRDALERADATPDNLRPLALRAMISASPAQIAALRKKMLELLQNFRKTPKGKGAKGKGAKARVTLVFTAETD